MISYVNVTFFDRYQAIKKLNETGVFASYLGTDLQSGDRVLIKVLNPALCSRYEVDKICFAKEVYSIRKFEHPNILKLIAADIYTNTICTVYEYSESQTSFTDFIENKGILPVSSALNIISQLAQALRYAHKEGICHRNIKPANINVSEKDGEFSVKLFDFGMSYVIDYMSANSEEVNQNFGYMAPETTGLLDRKVDGRSDLYSLGILLYRIITGRLPFTADSIDNMVYQHVAINPESPEKLNPEIPADVSKIVLKLIAKDPNLRYSEASELIDDIDRFLHNGSSSLIGSNEEILSNLPAKFAQICRRPELDKINALCTEAFTSGGKFCVLRGDWGSGKSNLFTNFCLSLKERNVTYFRTHFTDQTSLTPYSVFHDILENFCEVLSKYDRKTLNAERTRLAKAVNGCTDLAFSVCSNLKKYLPSSQTLPAIDSFKEQQRTLSLLANFILSLFPKDHPYVLVFGDLHHADPASITLLSEMISQLSEHNVFIITSFRSSGVSDNEYLGTFLRQLEATKYDDVVLQPFDNVRMCEFLSELLSVSRDNCRILAEYVLDKTEGNPYFALNYVRSLLEEGVISVRNGSISQNWEALRTVSSSDDMTDIINRRMEGLSDDAIDFLEAASVVGNEFSIKLMSVVTDISVAKIDSLLETAMELQFVDYVTSDLVAFSHSDVHTVFYDKLSSERINELHFQIAKAIEAQKPLPHNAIFNIVFHLNAAGAEEELCTYIMEAARLSRLSNASELAISYYERAVQLIEKYSVVGNDDWIIAKQALSELNLMVGNFGAAIDAATDLLPSIEDRFEKAKLHRLIGLAYFREGRLIPCEKALNDSLALLGEKISANSHTISFTRRLLSMHRSLAHDSIDIRTSTKSNKNTETVSLIVSVYEILCWVYIYTDFTKFEYVALKLHAYAKHNLNVSAELATSISTLSVYYALSGKRIQYDMALQLAMKLRNSVNDEYGIARSTYISAMCEQWFGNFSEAQKKFEEAAEMFEKIGDRWELNNTNLFMAYNLQMMGHYSDARKTCESVIKDSEKLGDNLSLCQAYSVLITCHTESGSYSSANDLIPKAKAAVTDLELPYATVSLDLAYGKLLLEQEKISEACKVLEDGHKIALKNSFISRYVSSIHGQYAMAKIKQLSQLRNSIELSVVQQHEIEIYQLCSEARRRTKQINTQSLPALRALALYGVMTDRFRLTEANYRIGSLIATQSQYTYEAAKLYYEYGRYLLSQHRYDSARFYIFEAFMSFSNINSVNYAKQCGDIIAERYREDSANNILLSDIVARKNRMNIDRKVNTLLKLGERLTSTLEVEDLQKKILQDAVELVGAERGILFLYPETGERKLYVASVFNLGSFDCNTYDWMLEEVERSRKPIVINDVQSDEYRKHYAVMVRYGIKSVMAMPMFVRGDLFGVIYLDSRLVRQIFSEEYIETMGFIANQAGAPIANARLYHRAITDSLTDIFGRSYLDNKVIDLTEQKNVRLSAIMIDVDNFKKCNDTYGHPFGDKVLKQIAGIMKRVGGEHGIPCRYGGEEFVVLLDSNNPDFVLSTAEKIRQLTESTAVAFSDGNEVKMISVTISLGVSIWDDCHERIDLIEHADKALYYAKEHGKNQVVLWTPDLPVQKKK